MCSRHRKLSLFAAAASLALSVAAHSNSTAQEGLVQAIWRVQHVDFAYYSPQHFYACDALKNKVRAILRAMGAHEALTIHAGCSGNSLVQQMSARISLAAPVEATAENILAATTFDARDKLVAKLRETRLPTAADIGRFPASWRSVSLSRDDRLHLDAGDCDLLNSIRKQVLPRMRVNVRKWARHCTHGATRTRSVYEIEALIPAKAASIARRD